VTRAHALAAMATSAILIAGACGGAKESVLRTAERRTADQQAGELSLELAASSGVDEQRTGPVGFRVEGPFSFDSENELAVVDLTYTQLLGANTEEMRLVSTGSKAYVTAAGETLEVPDNQLAALKLSDDNTGVAELGFAGWVDDPVVADGPAVDGDATQRITGTLDVPDMLSDLARIAAQVGGSDDLAPIKGDDATRIQSLVKTSDVEIIVGKDDHRLRSLHVVADFGREVPTELRDALGPYAATHLELTVSLRELTEPLEVTAPG
jgi:hypothetical protein